MSTPAIRRHFLRQCCWVVIPILALRYLPSGSEEKERNFGNTLGWGSMISAEQNVGRYTHTLLALMFDINTRFENKLLSAITAQVHVFVFENLNFPRERMLTAQGEDNIPRCKTSLVHAPSLCARKKINFTWKFLSICSTTCSPVSMLLSFKIDFSLM